MSVGNPVSRGNVAPSERSAAASVLHFLSRIWLDLVMLIVIGIVFVVPFIFIFLTASKTRQEASLFQFSWPSNFQLFENIRTVLEFGNRRMLLALWNSTVLTVSSITLIVLFAALIAYVLQRRNDRVANLVSSMMLAGLIIPPAVVPTIFLLQFLGIYKTLFGLILVEVAFTLPFATLILRAFVGSIPHEIDEAAIIDGASPLRVFLWIILPLLRPAIVTVIVVSSVGIFNDFAAPLYFLPGSQNVTAPLTLYSFMSQFTTQWNLLFSNVIVITIIPLVMFIFFQRQIVPGYQIRLLVHRQAQAMTDAVKECLAVPVRGQELARCLVNLFARHAWLYGRKRHLVRGQHGRVGGFILSGRRTNMRRTGDVGVIAAERSAPVHHQGITLLDDALTRAMVR